MARQEVTPLQRNRIWTPRNLLWGLRSQGSSALCAEALRLRSQQCHQRTKSGIKPSTSKNQPPALDHGLPQTRLRKPPRVKTKELLTSCSPGRHMGTFSSRYTLGAITIPPLRPCWVASVSARSMGWGRPGRLWALGKPDGPLAGSPEPTARQVQESDYSYGPAGLHRCPQTHPDSSRQSPLSES